MSIFPFVPSTPNFTPRINNIGVFSVNNVVDKSSVTVGDSSIGDILSHRKLNEGFGAVLGNANLIPASINLLFDADMFDQTGPQVQNKFSPTGVSVSS